VKRALNRIDRIEPSRGFARKAFARAHAGRCMAEHPVRLTAFQAVSG